MNFNFKLKMSVWFYPKPPEVDDIVICEVIEIDSIGSIARLVEYGNLKGLILHSELTRRKYDSYKSHTKIGLICPMQIIRMDISKGYIDLSRKNLNQEEIEESMTRFNRAKKVDSIINGLVEKKIPAGFSIKDHYENWCWPTFSIWEDCYEAMKEFSKKDNFEEIFPQIKDQDLKEELTRQIKLRFAKKDIELIKSLEVWSITPRGILEVKDALRAGKIDDSVKITQGDKGYYQLMIKTKTQKEGEQKLEIILNAINQKLTPNKSGCQFIN